MSQQITAGLFSKTKAPTDTEHTEIRQKLEQVRLQLACAEDLFNTATDEAMLDSCIYQIKSLQVYYSFLMRQLRLVEAERASLPCGSSQEEGGTGLLAAVKERTMGAMG